MNHLLLLHLVAFAMQAAGVVLFTTLTVAGRKTSSVAAQAVLAGLVKRAPILNMIGGLLLVGSGIALAITEGLSLGLPWISFAFTFWLLSVIVGGGLVRPFAAKFAADVAAAQGQGLVESDALRDAWTQGKVKGAARAQEILFLVLLLDMVYKPGL